MIKTTKIQRMAIEARLRDALRTIPNSDIKATLDALTDFDNIEAVFLKLHQLYEDCLVEQYYDAEGHTVSSRVPKNKPKDHEKEFFKAFSELIELFSNHHDVQRSKKKTDDYIEYVSKGNAVVIRGKGVVFSQSYHSQLVATRPGGMSTAGAISQAVQNQQPSASPTAVGLPTNTSVPHQQVKNLAMTVSNAQQLKASQDQVALLHYITAGTSKATNTCTHCGVSTVNTNRICDSCAVIFKSNQSRPTVASGYLTKKKKSIAGFLFSSRNNGCAIWYNVDNCIGSWELWGKLFSIAR